MEKVSEFKGIKGHLMAFKKEVEFADKIAFAGVPGVCTPFAQLFAYAIRDKKILFIPNTQAEKAKELIQTEYGMELGEISSPEADALVLLGGLSMPHIGSKIEDINKLTEIVLNENGNENRKLIGLCYMDMFKKAGWYDKISFDSVINANIEGFVLE